MGCEQKPETGSQSNTAAFTDTAAFIQKGQAISKKAFLTLSSNLQQALAECTEGRERVKERVPI